jgi:hypothetical protein
MTVKLTSGGIVNGALPICDCAVLLAEKALVWKAGRRKHGIVMEEEEARALSRPRALVVANMVVVWVDSLWFPRPNNLV